MSSRSLFDALSLVLGSIEAVRNLRALYLLLTTFCLSGLLLAAAESSFVSGSSWRGPLEAGAALFVAFYGGNAAGILVMDEARGDSTRDAADAVRVALARAHRLLVILCAVALVVALAAGLLVGLLWLCRVEVLGRTAGPMLFGLVVPVGVVGVGMLALVLAAVVLPLAAPAVWAGAGIVTTLRQLIALTRDRLLTVALLIASVSLLSAGVGVLVSFVVMAGGRVVSELAVRIVGVDVPAEELMAGLFGRGIRSMGAAGAPAGSTAHAAAALVGGGIVFAIGLVLPGIVYMRGTCAVYLALLGDRLPEPARRKSIDLPVDRRGSTPRSERWAAPEPARDPLGGSIDVPVDRGGSTPRSERWAAPEPARDPLGGSIDVPVDRGGSTPRSERWAAPEPARDPLGGSIDVPVDRGAP